MVQKLSRAGTPPDQSSSRRRFLAAVGGAAAMGVAGCSQLTSKSFSAGQVILPEEARNTLVLAETEQNSRTVTRTPSAGDVEGEITLTSHTAGYHRGPARGRPTLLEKYLGKVNGTKGAGPAAVANATDLGVEEVTFKSEGGEPLITTGGGEPLTVPASSASVVAPAGLRGDKSGVGALGLMYPPESIPELTPNTTVWSVPVADFFPDPDWNPADGGQTFATWGDETNNIEAWLSRWLSRPETGTDVPDPDSFADKARVFIMEDKVPVSKNVFGVAAEEMPGQKVDAGEEFVLNQDLFCIPMSSGVMTPFDDILVSEGGKIFDVGTPAPLGGATFGTAVVATPTAKMGGDVQNPFAKANLKTLIQSDRARPMLQQAGLTQAEDAEWLAGPREMTEKLGRPITYLGRKTELKSFAGIVSGRNGPWGVGLHVARVVVDGEDDEFAVIATGGHRAPVGEQMAADGQPLMLWDEIYWFDRGAAMTAAALQRLERV